MLADVTETADHVLRNRAAWDRWASDYAGAGPLATIEWARQWPCEEVWKARKVFGLDRA